MFYTGIGTGFTGVVSLINCVFHLGIQSFFQKCSHSEKIKLIYPLLNELIKVSLVFVSVFQRVRKVIMSCSHLMSGVVAHVTWIIVCLYNSTNA